MMFLPSVLFWGSGLLKDGLLLFALGILLYSFSHLLSGNTSIRNKLSFVFSLLLLMCTKLYVLFIILPALIAWFWSRNDAGKRVIIKFIVCYVIYLVAGFNIDKISEKYDVVDLIYYKQQNFSVLANASHANSFIEIPRIDATAGSLIRNSPAAVWRVLTRPWITDSSSLLILLSACENLFVLFFGMTCLLFSGRNNSRSPQMLCLSFTFVLFMFALIGLITPILGAMVRYKVPAMLFLVFLFVTLLDESKIAGKFQFIRKLM